MIQLRGVSKIFGERWAVRDLDLAVPRGEIFGLLGHNGAGKSTTIGMLLGQVWPTAGELRVCGHDITRDRAKALHRVGAIFETPVFYDFLSGWKNLEILSRYTGPTPVDRIKKIVDWVGLTGREHDKVSKYSHGMRTRLALALLLAGCTSSPAVTPDAGGDAGDAVDAADAAPPTDVGTDAFAWSDAGMPRTDYTSAGPHTVGNAHATITDRTGMRMLPVEVWYPAADSARAAGQTGPHTPRIRRVPASCGRPRIDLATMR